MDNFLANYKFDDDEEDVTGLMMDIIDTLEAEGLRKADGNEPGWYWNYYDENDELHNVWVTTIAEEKL